nr:hypothetical protein 2 [Deltaproteobacteria bacterium]
MRDYVKYDKQSLKVVGGGNQRQELHAAMETDSIGILSGIAYPGPGYAVTSSLDGVEVDPAPSPAFRELAERKALQKIAGKVFIKAVLKTLVSLCIATGIQPPAELGIVRNRYNAATGEDI